MQHQAEKLSLFNDGQVPCQFEFIQKPNETTYCKPWLTANPHKGFVAQGGFHVYARRFLRLTKTHSSSAHSLIEQQASAPFTLHCVALRYFTLHQFLHFSSVVHLSPGATVDIDLEVFVNRSTAPDLNSGKEQIEEILVLHLERGKDYFISVTGNYLPSCFGTSIRSLCQMREPIQDTPAEILRKLVSGTISIHVHHLLFGLCAARSVVFLCFKPLREARHLRGCFKAVDCCELVETLSLRRLSKLSLLSTPG